MKYMIRLRQTVEKIVVVDANSSEEADKKLLHGNIEKEYKYIKTEDVYNGWDYVDFKIAENDEPINNSIDVAKVYELNRISELKEKVDDNVNFR